MVSRDAKLSPGFCLPLTFSCFGVVDPAINFGWAVLVLRLAIRINFAHTSMQFVQNAGYRLNTILTCAFYGMQVIQICLPKLYKRQQSGNLYKLTETQIVDQKVNNQISSH